MPVRHEPFSAVQRMWFVQHMGGCPWFEHEAGLYKEITLWTWKLDEGLPVPVDRVERRQVHPWRSTLPRHLVTQQKVVYPCLAN